MTDIVALGLSCLALAGSIGSLGFTLWVDGRAERRRRVDDAFRRGVREGRRAAEAERPAPPADWQVTDTAACSPSAGGGA